MKSSLSEDTVDEATHCLGRRVASILDDSTSKFDAMHGQGQEAGVGSLMRKISPFLVR